MNNTVLPVQEVPLLDLQAPYQKLKPAILAAIEEVCDSQYFILGPRVKALEERIAEYCHCAYGIGVSSGTDALLAALMALEIGPGDAVITTPYTFFATAGTIHRLGARPIFCDIDPVSFNLSPAAVAQLLREDCEWRDGILIHRRTGSRIKAIMPVHLFGQCADMEALMALAQEFRLRVIEDAAQAIGSETHTGQRAGCIGDIACFSFFPSKNLGAFGDAGLCTTNDAQLAERLRILRVHGSKPKYYHALVGGNFRLDELQAAVLLVKLGALDSWTQARQQNAGYYDQAFDDLVHAGHISIPVRAPGIRHIYNQYVIRVHDRDALRRHLQQQAIGTEVYYPVPLHRQACFADLGYQADDCPEAMRAAHETLALPIYPGLSAAQQDYVVEQIRAFYPGG